MGKELWFKRKTYGWGWQPANMKGWMATLIYILSVALYPIIARTRGTEMRLYLFFPIAFLLTCIFIMVCILKGEKPRWQWGKKD